MLVISLGYFCSNKLLPIHDIFISSFKLFIQILHCSEASRRLSFAIAD